MRVDPANGLGRGGRDRPRAHAAADAGRHRGDAPARRTTSSTTSATAATSGSATPQRAVASRGARLGFTYEGRFRNAMVYKGRNRDTDWFSITDAEWPARARRATRPGSTPPTSTTPGRPTRTRLGAGPAQPSDPGPSVRMRGRVRGMDQRVSFITLAVPDLEATRRFYVDGLGWEPAMHVPGEVLMIQVGDKSCCRCGSRRLRGRGRPDPARRGPRPDHAGPQPAPPARRSTPSSSRPGPPGRRTSARRSSASGVATPATSATPTATAGRSPTTPARSDRRCCP